MPRFALGNGIVKDLRTCLVWEKKTGTVGGESLCPGGATCADPHNVNNRYTWSTGSPWNFDGSAATDFLAKLNTPPGFAGHTDWRLPTSAGSASYPTGQDPELESILTAQYPNCKSSPCIDTSVFGPAAAYNWSSSSYAANPFGAWNVYFDGGIVFPVEKNFNYCVRAVRGGP